MSIERPWPGEGGLDDLIGGKGRLCQTRAHREGTWRREAGGRGLGGAGLPCEFGDGRTLSGVLEESAGPGPVASLRTYPSICLPQESLHLESNVPTALGVRFLLSRRSRGDEGLEGRELGPGNAPHPRGTSREGAEPQPGAGAAGGKACAQQKLPRGRGAVLNVFPS